MSNYRRAWHAGGTYFVTDNLLQRHHNDLLVRHIDLLQRMVAVTRQVQNQAIKGSKYQRGQARISHARGKSFANTASIRIGKSLSLNASLGAYA